MGAEGGPREEGLGEASPSPEPPSKDTIIYVSEDESASVSEESDPEDEEVRSGAQERAQRAAAQAPLRCSRCSSGPRPTL